MMSAKKNSIDLAGRELAAQQAADLFIAHPLFQASQHVACYLARDHEFDAFAIIQALWRAGKKCYVPIVNAAENTLAFVHYQQDDTLVLNRYHIWEPEQTSIVMPAAALDIVIAPMMAFDKQGHRLGMGKGYYDKTFSFLVNEEMTKPLMIGLAYELQCVDALPVESWDVTLDGVLTEENFYWF